MKSLVLLGHAHFLPILSAISRGWAQQTGGCQQSLVLLGIGMQESYLPNYRIQITFVPRCPANQTLSYSHQTCTSFLQALNYWGLSHHNLETRALEAEAEPTRSLNKFSIGFTQDLLDIPLYFPSSLGYSTALVWIASLAWRQLHQRIHQLQAMVVKMS